MRTVAVARTAAAAAQTVVATAQTAAAADRRSAAADRIVVAVGGSVTRPVRRKEGIGSSVAGRRRVVRTVVVAARWGSEGKRDGKL